MSNKFASSIALPKGGGALSGMGEKFAPDLHTGTGNFSVPLNLPPGRNGFQPSLSLAYSSGHPNSPFGLGWDISVPLVARKTSNGLPQYNDAASDWAERDVFILSGAEDLVITSDSATITSYRPRTEGLFARIRRYHNPSARHDYWEVRTKDGLVSLYGTPGQAGNDPAALADPDNRNKVFAWKLTCTTDPFGNRIDYEYLRDSGADGPRHWDQLYLRQIRYVDYVNNSGQTSYLVMVTFHYADRPDPFSEYRAGFEIRTCKRCERIEMKSNAEAERLIRTYHLTYLDQQTELAGQLPLNGVSLLSAIQVAGQDESGTEEMPPLKFGYSRFTPERRDFRPVSGPNLPPASLAHGNYELADLFGNGLPAFFELNGSARYWRNRGDGCFDGPREMAYAPAGVSLGQPGVQLIDANGDSRADLLVSQPGAVGYYPLNFTGQWDSRSFQRYEFAPSVGLEDPEVRLVDLDGDGVTDVLRTGSQLECYFNHKDPAKAWRRTCRVAYQERADFPTLSFSDTRLKLADMSGDGLQDIVLVHNGLVEYWPNLGRGNWGQRITMRHCPRLPLDFDPKRLLLGDVDGDGLADLLYVENERVTLWMNQSGNGWSEPVIIKGTPQVTDLDAVRLIDLKGSGISGVLFSSEPGAHWRHSMYYLDLCAGTKPYLLSEMDNNMGAVTRVTYAPSTHFYLQDQQTLATRWKTPLPFPVQVVAQTEVCDRISGGKLTTRYQYHHGYWDGAEREFRGFGMVEQYDTETFDDYHRSDGLPGSAVSQQHFAPPTLTKTWFHQGPVGEEFGEWREADYSGEYWQDDPTVLSRLPATTNFLLNLPRRARRDAVRALRGRVLRTELYALDGSERQSRPYTVKEYQYGLYEVVDQNGKPQLKATPAQPARSDYPRMFYSCALGERTTQWERGEEPLLTFSFTGAYDDYGQPRTQLNIAVPRGRNIQQDLTGSATAPQPYLATYTRTDYAYRDEVSVFMADRVTRVTTYEVQNDGREPLFTLKNAVDDGTISPARLKIFGQSVNFYDGPALQGLAYGQLGAYGALVRSETLAFTEETLREAYQSGSAGANTFELPPVLLPITPPPRVNFARAEYGATVSASSSVKGFDPILAIDGVRAATGYWQDDTPKKFGDWLQVDFGGEKVIDEIVIYSVPDNPYSMIEPHDGMIFTRYGLTDFEVQFLGKEDWETVPGGVVQDNNLVVRRLTFAQISTSSIRIIVSQSADGISSRVAEIEAWGFQADDTCWAEYPAEFRASLPVHTPSDPTRPGLLMTPAGYGIPEVGGIFALGYWTATLRQSFDFHVLPMGRARGVCLADRDALGRDTTALYDQYQLFPVQLTDPVGLTTSAVYDYRAMQAREVSDPNGNRKQFAFTPLGLLQSALTLGKLGENLGDTPEAPSLQLVYDFKAFAERGQPVSVRTIQRSHHANDNSAPPEEQNATLEKVEYSDGLGRLIQVRTQAEDVIFGNSIYGDSSLNADQGQPVGDTVGQQRPPAAPPNVIVSGWQTFDNKGRVVEKYEPFFAVGWDYLARQAASPELFGQKTELFYDPLGQVWRTVFPNGAEQLELRGMPTELSNPASYYPSPWYVYTYDTNDNAGRTHPGTTQAYASHYDTPVSTLRDALGRVVETTVRNGPDPAANWDKTISTYDIRGNLLSVTDPLGRVAFRYTYDFANRTMRVESLDNGVQRSVYDAAGRQVESRDSKGSLVLQAYDRAGRLVRRWARDDQEQSLTLREKLIYGENLPQSLPANMLGRPYRHYDEAGLVTFVAYDFKGNVLEKTRQVIQDEQVLSVFADATSRNWQVQAYRVDWEPPAEVAFETHAANLLDPTLFTTTMSYDALNRVRLIRYPQDVAGERRELRPHYNNAGALEQVWVDEQLYVERIAYNAKGQRTLIAYGNGVMTRYAYDPHTFRLTRLRTERYTRQGDAATPMYHPTSIIAPLQDYAYEHDLAGNILKIKDRTPESGVPNNPPYGVQGLDRVFTYDPLYRLLSATGRECNSRPLQPWEEASPTYDVNSARSYTEQYSYDPANNLRQLQHHSADSGFVRTYELVSGSNRLATMTTGQAVYAYSYDAAGNTLYEGTSRFFEWDYANRLKSYCTQAGSAEPSVYTHYLYDGAGIRVKKLVRKQGGNYEATVYVDGIFEHHRSVQVDGVIENNSLHVMDNQQRIALVRIGPPFPDDLSPAVKFHLGDHLGSSNLVIDGSGSWIQREEFTPYGESSFGGFARKRYRYTGKERNEESGLNYHGARYYSPWLARWLSCDPAGMADGLNIYAYTRNNPLNHVDPDGASSRDGGTAVSSSDVNGTPPTPEELGPSRAIPQRSEVAGYVNEANPTYSQLDDCFSVSNGPPLLTEERLKYMGGTLYGTLQSIPFGGDLAPSPLPNDYTFEFARGSAQAATGVAMMAGGTGGIVGGGGLSATGAGAVVGVPTLAVSGAALIKGTMSVAASTQTLAHANTLRRSGSNGSSTAGLRSGPSAAVEERFMPKKYRVNMKKAPLSSPRTAEGWQRNSKWFWRELSASNPELFSASNQALIKEGLAPVVDDVWLKYHPEHQLYEGDFLVHHHIEGGQWAAGIPRAFHQLFHGPLHY